MAAQPIRIAMWSGPRNISTALMRSWEARGDCAVTDEPLYAPYLLATGHDHPAAAEVIAAHETDLPTIITTLTTGQPPDRPPPDDQPIWYQKHMAHHLLPGLDRSWILQLRNVLLIREPRAMLASLARVIDNPTPEQTGLPQQVELLTFIEQQTAAPPPVIDSRDVLQNPRGMLSALCRALDVPFTDAMLTWSPGLRDTDGVWAKHWYDRVAASTGFEPYTESEIIIPDQLIDTLTTCESLYTRLHHHRLTCA